MAPGPSINNGGRIPVCTRNPPIYAAVVTSQVVADQLHNNDKAHRAQQAQAQGPSGCMKPGHSVTLLGFTDVVVTRNGGVDNEEVEQALCWKNPVDIVQAAQRAINKASHNPPLILRGRWSEMVQKTGNFIFCFVGELSMSIICSFMSNLLENFPDGVFLVPTKGWTWVQLRGMDVSYKEDGVSYLYEGDQLLRSFQANLCFQDADIFVEPHWQGNPLNFKDSTQVATVIAAIGDADNSKCQHASSEGVCMFGQQVKFVWVGSTPSLVQCSRCHELGHYFSSLKCRLPTHVSCCFRCGGPHDSLTHDFECNRTHKVVGKCNCVPICLLCKAKGHHARDCKCPLCGDFVPPRLPKVAPIEARPLVEDTRVVVLLATPCSKAQPTSKGKGKGKAKVEGGAAVEDLIREAGESMLPEICKKLGDYQLLCFCCPIVTVRTGKTPDSAVMTTRAGM
jgi:hypothetical protein